MKIIADEMPKTLEQTIRYYDFEDAVDFIHGRCSVDEDTIRLILNLDTEYMRSIGIIEECW